MEKPDKHRLTPAERIFVRISVLQTALAVIGIFTGAVALYAALNESDAVRKQLYASVWPHIEVGTDRWTKEAIARSDEFRGIEGPLFRFTVSNSGIGPAKITSVQITVDGEAKQTWAQVLQSLIGSSDVRFGSSTISGRVVRAGEVVNLVTLFGEPAQRLEENLTSPVDQSRRVVTRICYCSVFDQCWITKDEGRLSEPESAGECPDFSEEAFLD